MIRLVWALCYPRVVDASGRAIGSSMAPQGGKRRYGANWTPSMRPRSSQQATQRRAVSSPRFSASR